MAEHMVISIGALRLLRPPTLGGLSRFPGVAMANEPILVDEGAAAWYAGRPGVTIRRWAHEGRIRRYGRGRGQVRYNILELNMADRDEFTNALIEPGEVPPLPEGARAA